MAAGDSYDSSCRRVSADEVALHDLVSRRRSSLVSAALSLLPDAHSHGSARPCDAGRGLEDAGRAL